MSMMTKLGYYI